MLLFSNTLEGRCGPPVVMLPGRTIPPQASGACLCHVKYPRQGHPLPVNVLAQTIGKHTSFQTIYPAVTIILQITLQKIPADIQANQLEHTIKMTSTVLTAVMAKTLPLVVRRDVRNYSKSWDNILIPQMEKEHAISRGRSYENLYHQQREVLPDNRQKPVIINLSSSPRRYAALSLSENSLEKYASEGKMGMGQNWFVTPEITITDNDIRAGNSRNKDSGSVSWDLEKGRRIQNENAHNLARPSDPLERKHNNSTLKQSLEQLDELLADLVIDYIPQNSRQSNKELIDQLKQLINDDDVKGEQILDQEDSGRLTTQTDSSKTSPDTFKDPDSGCEGFPRSAEDISLNHTRNDDDAMVCSNSKCQHKENLFNASLYFKSCHSCHTYYCSRNCRWEDWDTHKKTCMYSRISSVCRHILKHCRENSEVHKAFSRIAKVGYLSRGRGVLFIGFPNPGSADNFLQVGLESLLMSPVYLSLRELDSFKDNLGEYCKELQDAGKQYDPNECFLLNVSIAIGELMFKRPSPRLQAPTVRKYAKVSLASSSPDKKVLKKESDMETLILTPPPGTSDIDKEGQEVALFEHQRHWIYGEAVAITHFDTIARSLCLKPCVVQSLPCLEICLEHCLLHPLRRMAQLCTVGRGALVWPRFPALPPLPASTHAGRPIVRRSKPLLKQVRTWPAGAIFALQDCFEQTTWITFKEAATDVGTVNLEEYTASVTGYISKCIDDVTVSKTITTRPNHKP
ncbi:hypothetical protein P4O66_003022 [Electrophorus voltai]|uniref:Apical junction molecule ajm1 alpha/beta domain-containing protein n=1 Tax=Electrophorus voltai TaxID=2609070 RepID=A0AAD9DN80_9TELE|nr:hypothetical protein P4O66_003022 [Electrophorus voltai]